MAAVHEALEQRREVGQQAACLVIELQGGERGCREVGK